MFLLELCRYLGRGYVDGGRKWVRRQIGLVSSAGFGGRKGGPSPDGWYCVVLLKFFQWQPIIMIPIFFSA